MTYTDHVVMHDMDGLDGSDIKLFISGVGSRKVYPVNSRHLFCLLIAGGATYICRESGGVDVWHIPPKRVREMGRERIEDIEYNGAPHNDDEDWELALLMKKADKDVLMKVYP